MTDNERVLAALRDMLNGRNAIEATKGPSDPELNELRGMFVSHLFSGTTQQRQTRGRLLPKLKAEQAITQRELAAKEARIREIEGKLRRLGVPPKPRPKPAPKKLQDDRNGGNDEDAECKCPECGHEAPCEDFRNADQASTTSAYYLRRMQGLRR